MEGAKIKVYRPAKTVADCFKFRSKIGTALALEALREGFREKKSRVKVATSFDSWSGLRLEAGSALCKSLFNFEACNLGIGVVVSGRRLCRSWQ